MENGKPKFLEVQNLTISFNQEGQLKPVLNSLSYTLSEGETLGLVGESGSGKSVSALSILGLLGSSAKVTGKILFSGLNILGQSEKSLRKIRGIKISMIFQEPMTSLNPVISCGEQVAEILKVHLKLNSKEAKSESIRLFGEVELPSPEKVFDSHPYQLSGGQRQRVMIAMAICTNPEILIADEPTTALDVTVQKTIVDLLLRLKKNRGMSMIFISHDLGLVNLVADKVLILYKGNLVEQGLTEQIFRYPKHPYTQGLLACRPIENQGLSRLPVNSDFMEVDSAGNLISKLESIEEVRARLKTNPELVAARRESIYEQKPVIQVQDLSKKYKNYTAVNNVSFDIFPGETLGLVGESGCGKSTLARSLILLIEPTAGHIFFKNEDLTKISPKKLKEFRKKMQLIFQDPYSSLNPRQTIGDTLMEPLEIFKIGKNSSERKIMALELLEKVQMLPEHFYRYPHEFSGGQRQRIGIARALSLSPEFIICDESVSALDVSIQAQIINLLISLREEYKLTILFISHDLSVVRFISDRILVMNKGKFEEEGTPDEIYFKPKSDYTKRLLEAIPNTIYNS